MRQKVQSSSVRMTKARLSDALVELLITKPVREISVRELTHMAMVSRGTFYFHYADIYDLLNQVEQVEIDHLNDLLDHLLPQLDIETPPPALQALFEYIDANTDICTALLGPYGDTAFIRRLESVIRERCLGYLAADGTATELQTYLIAFAAQGCFGAVETWLASGKQTSIAQMTAMTWQAIRAVRNAPQ